MEKITNSNKPPILHTSRSRSTNHLSLTTTTSPKVRRPFTQLSINPVKVLSPLEEPAQNPFSSEINSERNGSSTLIKDVDQSYQFLRSTELLSLDEDVSEESIRSFSCEIKESTLLSTMDPKSFYQNPSKPEYFSTILTVSSSSDDRIIEKEGNNEDEEKERFDSSHSLLSSVVAYCNTCNQNVTTLVIENLYPGSFFERMFCFFSERSSKIREFCHICDECQSTVFKIKIKRED